VTHPAREPRILTGALRFRTFALALLGVLAGMPATIAFAEPPRGGEILLLDRQNIETVGRPLVMGIDPATHGVRNLAYPLELNSPLAITWGIGKRLYIGDGYRLWECDSYEPPYATPELITHPWVEYVTDLVPVGDGRLYVLDQIGDPLGEGYSGALLRFDPQSRAFELIMSDPRFISPRRMLVEAGGTLLVLDPRGRMRWSAPPNGALYRVDPDAHSMTSLVSLDGMETPNAIALLAADTLVVVDSDLSFPGHEAHGGGILKLVLPTFAVVDTIAVPGFLHPSDLVVLPAGDAFVLDELANPTGSPGTRGAVFHIDLHTGELIATVTRPSMRALTSIERYEGPDLDASVVELVDVNGGQLHPGERLRFQTTLASHGPVAPGSILLTLDTGELTCLFGSASWDRGSAEYDPTGKRFQWTGELAAEDAVELSVDLVVPMDTPNGTLLELPLRLSGALVEREQLFGAMAYGTTAIPSAVYADADSLRPPAPRLCTLVEGGRTPETLYSDPGGLLPRPIDVAYGIDGVLYVLDADAETPKVLARDWMTSNVSVIHQGAPFSPHVQALALAHDGSLLVVDAKGDAEAGVIYRLDPHTGAATVFFTAEVADSFPNPVDICVDRNGHYLVCETDLKTGVHASGGLFELDADGGLLTVYRKRGVTVDPYSACVDPDGSIYLLDRADGYAGGPSLFWVRRQPGTPAQFFRIVGTGHELLEKPSGIVRIAPDTLIICDRESNTINPGRGSLISFHQVASGASVFEYRSFHIDWRQPHRCDAFRPAELTCSSLLLEDVNAGELRPGDVLEVIAVLDNSTPMPGLGAVASIGYSDRLHLLYQSTSGGTIRANETFHTLEWSGDLRFADPETLTIGFTVDALAIHGDEAAIAVALLGGVDPEPASASARISGPLKGDEILVLDPYANPLNPEHHGTIFAADFPDERMLPFRGHTYLTLPSDIASTAPNRLLVLDRDADPTQSGFDTGALFELNTENNFLRTLSASRSFVNPTRLVRAPAGDWYVLDPSARPCGPAYRGAIYRVPAEGGVPTLVACSKVFRKLADLTVDSDGILWVTDREANPADLATDDTGAVFAIDPASGAVIDTVASEELVDPDGILWVPGTGLLVTDPSHYQSGFTGVRKLDVSTGALTYVVSSPFFGTPTRMLALSSTEILIADSTGVPPGSSLPGAIYRADIALHELGAFLQNSDAHRIQALATVPYVGVTIAAWETLDEPPRTWRATGDTVHCELRIANPSLVAQPHATLGIRLTPTLVVDPLSVSVSEGSTTVQGDSLHWEGAIAAKDTVTIRYAAAVGLIPGTAPWAEQFAELKVSYGDPSADTLSLYVASATANGELIVCDAWAHPRAGSLGAVFRGELQTHVMVPVLVSPLFRTPLSVLLLPGSATDMLVVDATARPSGAGTGALFRGSTRTGEVTLLFRQPSLRLPVAVAAADSFTCFLLDADADPWGLRPGAEGPGAIYRVDIAAGTGTVLASDIRFWEPRDLVINETTGMLYLVDEGDGTLAHPGTVFSVDPISGAVNVVLSGGVLTSPRCATLNAGGRLYVMNAHEEIGGVVYFIDPGEQLDYFAQCNSVHEPMRLLLDGLGRILCADATANPQGWPGTTGSILRLSRGSAACWVHSSGSPLARPSGISARFDGTPVSSVALNLVDTARGVEVRWDAPGELRGAGFFVFRQAIEESGSTYAALNPQAPVTGTGPLCYVDVTAIAGELYAYLLVALMPDGSRREFGPLEIRASGIRARFYLARPSPNPLPLQNRAGGVALSFGVPEPGGHVRLTLFDLTGRRLIDLVDGFTRPGTHGLQWDGRDRGGHALESGVYFLRLEMGARVAVQRMVMVR
jgi:sugar lactone lactonase YvrE